jgi:hypothetical protein
LIADNSAASIEAFVKANVKRGTTLLTDGHKSYLGLTGYRVLGHVAHNEPASYWDIIKRGNTWKSPGQSGAHKPLHIDEPESAG